jgi:hypothetical protein
MGALYLAPRDFCTQRRVANILDRSRQTDAFLSKDISLLVGVRRRAYDSWRILKESVEVIGGQARTHPKSHSVPFGGTDCVLVGGQRN